METMDPVEVSKKRGSTSTLSEASASAPKKKKLLDVGMSLF